MATKTTGMDGARVQLPSGRWSDDPALHDFRTVKVDDAAWIVARFMFSHAVDHRFYGSPLTALRNTWPTGDVEPLRRAVHKVVTRHGFRFVQDPERPYWAVPDTFPVWESAKTTTVDDGSSTTGGPVTVRNIRPAANGEREVWTGTMATLMAAILNEPNLHPWQYADALGWVRSNTSSVGHTLKSRGYITAPGHTSSVRYLPTGKPLPERAARKVKRERARLAKTVGAGEAESVTGQGADVIPTPPPRPQLVASAVEPVASARVVDPMTVDDELATLARVLRAVSNLSPESRAWLVSRLNAEAPR